jgi:hypothetical protein
MVTALDTGTDSGSAGTRPLPRRGPRSGGAGRGQGAHRRAPLPDYDARRAAEPADPSRLVELG